MARMIYMWGLKDEQLTRTLSYYVTELHTQTAFAQGSLRHVDAALGLIIDKSKAAHDELFFGLHGLVSAGGNISKMLWPAPRNPSSAPGRRAHERGDTLRALMDVSDTSPLRLRDVRDGLEHFDERIDRVAYLLTDPDDTRGDAAYALVQDTIFSVFDVFVFPNGGQAHFLRAVALEPTPVLRVLDRDLEIAPFVAEITRLHKKSDAWILAHPELRSPGVSP